MGYIYLSIKLMIMLSGIYRESLCILFIICKMQRGIVSEHVLINSKTQVRGIIQTQSIIALNLRFICTAAERWDHYL